MIDTFRTFPTSPTDEQLAYVLKNWSYARIDNWIDTDFNTFSWWFQITLVILSLLVWWKLVEKKRLLELTFYGFSIMTVSIWLDQVGYELGIWYYPLDIIPVFPPSTSIDYILLPVIYALIYQYYSCWKQFLIATCIMSGIFSFVMEPLLARYGFYVPIDWKTYYSFPTYITIGIVMKAIVEKIKTFMANS